MSNRTHDHHATRHARQRWALAAAERADAKSAKAHAKASRREGAGRRAYLEALRLADLAEG